MTTELPAPGAAEQPATPDFSTDPATCDLPRPSTFDEAIVALSMAAAKHPKNRVLPELRGRADGGPVRSGDLRAMAAILEIWRDSQSADMSSERLSPSTVAFITGAPPEDRVEPHTGDPFTGPAPVDIIDVSTVVDPTAIIVQSALPPDPFTGPAPVMETTEGAIAVPPSLPAQLATTEGTPAPAPKAPARKRRAPRKAAPAS